MKRIGGILRKILIIIVILVVLFVAGVFIFHTIQNSDEMEMLEAAGYYNPVSVGDYSLNVVKFGNKEGKHTVVGMAGLYSGDFAVAMRKSTRQLEEDNLVVFVDRAGYGFSEDSSEDMTLENIVEDYRKALKNAGIEAPYVLMGHSIGGAYATYWESRYPEEIEGVIFVDGSELSANAFSDYTETSENMIEVLLSKAGLSRFVYKDFFYRYPDIYSEEEQNLADALILRTMDSFSPCSEEKLIAENAQKAFSSIVKNDIPKLYICSSLGFDSRQSIEDYNKWINRQIDKNSLKMEKKLEVYEDDDQSLQEQLDNYSRQREERLQPYVDSLGNCTLTLLGGDHVIYQQKPEELGELMAQFVKGVSGADAKAATLESFQKEAPEGMYSMTYYGGYHFDDYLKEGFTGNAEKQNFIGLNVLGTMENLFVDNYHDCSTFVCRNEKKEVLFCRNFDTSNVSPCCFVTTEGKDGFRSISGTDLSIACNSETHSLELMGARKVLLLALPYYTHDGMNEYGLAVAVLSTGRAKTNLDASKKTLDCYDVSRIVLEKAKNVDEAVELLKNYNVDFGTVMNNDPYHFMIADSTGKAVVVEWGEGNMVTVESAFATNFNLYGTNNGVGQDRFETIKRTLGKSNGVLSTNSALKLLEKVCMKNMERYSVVYNLTTGDVTAFGYGDSSVTTSFHLDMTK